MPGLGGKTLARIQALGLENLLDVSPREWLRAVRVRAPAASLLASLDRLSSLSELIRERAARGDMGITFRGEREYPSLLAAAPDAPEVLFYRGTPTRTAAHYVALVGSRTNDSVTRTSATAFAAACAERGFGIVSGAAVGVDQHCHRAALKLGALTWAFLGSALDEIDPAQLRLLPAFLERGGTFFSELPPGVRASRDTFPRRNRLIAGASEVVVVMAARHGSGSLYTASYARKQGKPIFVHRPHPTDEKHAGSRYLLARGGPDVQVCESALEVWRAVELSGGQPADCPFAPEMLRQLASRSDGEREAVSAAARRALTGLTATPRTFAEILEDTQMTPAVLTSALCELELAGWILQHPGKLYERI